MPSTLLKRAKLPKILLASRLDSLIDCCRRNLEKAFEIGNFRRTGLDDGNIARILWRQATIDPTQELEDKLDQAQLMRTAVEKNTGARIGREEPDEVSYDKLVCGYFR